MPDFREFSTPAIKESAPKPKIAARYSFRVPEFRAPRYSFRLPEFQEFPTPSFAHFATNLDMENPRDYPVHVNPLHMHQANWSHSTISALSRSDDEEPSILPPQEKPPVDDVRLNGGFTAWSQVFVSFLLVFNGFGYFSSFGLFQSHWTEVLHATPSQIAWVGSLSLFLLFFLGTLSGPLMDRGHFRSIIIVGCAFQVLGAFSTSGVSTYWQLILAQGIVQGIGNGMLFTPCVALVSTYFTKNRAFALSLAACGAPIGGITFPLVRSCPHLVNNS